MEQAQEWSKRLAAHIGQRVAFLRARLSATSGTRVTTQALADRTAELGHPMDRSVIAKLEKGLRHAVTVPELFVLAAALEMPPPDLLLPLGTADTVEVLPGVSVPPVVALDWLIGDRVLPDHEWTLHTSRMFRSHTNLVSQWRVAHDTGQTGQAASWGDAIMAVRRSIRSEGLTPPELPPELAGVEGEQ